MQAIIVSDGDYSHTLRVGRTPETGLFLALCRFGLTLALLLAPAAAPAYGAQQENAYARAYWEVKADEAIRHVDQNIHVRETAPATTWAGGWVWNDEDPSAGGDFGLQSDGLRFDGTTGPTAVFSISDANGTRGPNCGTAEGGHSCRIAHQIKTDRLYRLRLWRRAAEGANQWWGAWIMDQTTGVEQFLGEISAPSNATAVHRWMTFTEYRGEAVPSPQDVPHSVADFFQPKGMQDQFGATFARSLIGSGTTGSVAVQCFCVPDSARITIGGPAPEPIAAPPTAVPPAPAPAVAAPAPSPPAAPPALVPSRTAAAATAAAAASSGAPEVPRFAIAAVMSSPRTGNAHLRLRLPRRGTVTVAAHAPGVRAAVATARTGVREPGLSILTLNATRSGRRLLVRRGWVRVRLTATLRPASRGGPATTRRTVILRLAKRGG